MPKLIRLTCLSWCFYPAYFFVTLMALAAVKHPLTASSPFHILLINSLYWIFLLVLHIRLVKSTSKPEYATDPELMLAHAKMLKRGLRPFFIIHTVLSVLLLLVGFTLLFGMVIALIPFPLLLAWGALATRSVFDSAYARLRSKGRS